MRGRRTRLGIEAPVCARIAWHAVPEIVRTLRRDGGLVCVLNAGTGPIPLPAGEILFASGELADGMLVEETR